MASLALAGLISSFGLSATIAPIVTGLGVAVGSYIDQAFILPALFPPDDIEGPRLADIRTQFADEGAPINIGLGSDLRTNATVIWISDLAEIRISEEVGGKGGGGQKVTHSEYLISMACMFASTDGLPITRISEITASGKPIYRYPETLTFNGTVDTNTVITTRNQYSWDIVYSGGIDLGSFIAGGEVVITGLGNAVNNGTFEILSSSSDAGAGTSRLRLRNALGVAEIGGTANIVQNIAAFNDSTLETIEIYLGSGTQNPSPTIESFEGIGNVPAWRGFAYVVLKNLNLTTFGNLPPQLNIIWKPGLSTNVGDMVNDVARRAGLGSSWATIDPSLTQSVLGYPIQGVANAASLIQPLGIAANMLAQSDDLALKFFARTSATIIDVPASELSAHASNSEPEGRPFSIQDASEHQLAESMVVKYIDHQQRYQGGAQTAKTSVEGVAGAQRVVNLPLVLTDAGLDAQRIAQRLLFDSFNRRELIRLSLSPRWAHVQENDILRVQALGRLWYLLVRRVDRGANWVLKLECTAEVRDSLIQVAASEPPGGAIVTFSPENHVIMFLPVGVPTPTPAPGPGPTPGRPDWPAILVPYIHTDPSRASVPAALWVSSDDEDGEFEEYGILTTEAVIGFTHEILSGTDITGLVEDNENEIDIELIGGSLASVADDYEWYRGRLALQVGEEIVFAKTATLTGERRYTVTGLLRGMKGTIAGAATHAIGDQVILLSGPGIADSMITIPDHWVGTTRLFKAVPSGRDITEVPEVSMAITDGGVVPEAPVGLFHNRDTNGDISLRWDRVSKTYAPAFGPGTSTLAPFPSEKYEIDIGNADGGTVYLTVSIESDNEVEVLQSVLTAADAAAKDTSILSARVYQINETLGASPRGLASDLLTIPAAPIP